MLTEILFMTHCDKHYPLCRKLLPTVAAHHRSAALAVYFSLVNLQEMFGLKHLTTFVTLIWSLLLELDNMVCGLDFMTSKTCQQASKLVFSSGNNHL